MQEFRRPKPNAIVITACKLILPFWLGLKEHLSIKIRGSKGDLAAFSKSKRAVVLLNHPDRQDPFVLCHLANHMREEFYCIAARECFEWDSGWRGWLFQRLGCYSVRRGTADFHSIATTEKILREGRRKLVVFPEAEITADDNQLHELHKAIFHIILDVQKKLSQETAANAHNAVVIIPAAIKFSLNCSLDIALGPVLNKIEKYLGLSSANQADVHSRINAVVQAYLSRVFDSYGLEKPDASLEKLAQVAAVEMLQNIASMIGMDCDETLSPTDRLYTVRNKAIENTEMGSAATDPKAFFCAGIAKPSISSDFERIERLLIMERMLLHISSPIQCCRLLDFIESELFGTITAKGRQSCVVSIGTAIDVSSFVELYSESKDKGVDSLSECVRQKLQAMLLST